MPARRNRLLPNVSRMNASSPLELGFTADSDHDRARELLLSAEFTPAGVTQALGREHMLAILPSELPAFLHRTRGGSARDTFIRLFLLEQAVAEEQVGQALTGMSLDTWLDAGLLTRDSGKIIAAVRILPYQHLYLASDRTTEIHQGARTDFVMSLGHATELLNYMAIATGGRQLLDMGTGCGALGLLAASHQQQVLATDINPRAIAFTQFNARFNGIERLTAVAGDMFGPAADASFDHILCNPPFVIAPRARYTFRDSGRRGDAFCREVARAVPEHLAEGGYFQMLANCPHIAGRQWRADWQAWFEDVGCDCIVWANETVDIEEYAATWIRDTESTDAEQKIERFEQWMSYYESQQIEAVTYGVVTMRKRSGTNFIVIDDADRQIVGPCGEQVEQAFHLEDQLAQLNSEAELLESVFQLASSASVVETSLANDQGDVVPHSAVIQLQGGVRIESQLDPAALEVVRGCNGRTPLEHMLPGLSKKFDVTPDNLATALPMIVLQLARRGYLILVESQGKS